MNASTHPSDLKRAYEDGLREGTRREGLHLAKMVERRVRRLRASAFAAAMPEEASYAIAEAEEIAHGIASGGFTLERVSYYFEEHVTRRKYREHETKKERGAGEQLAFAFGPLVDVRPTFVVAPPPEATPPPPAAPPRATRTVRDLLRRRRPRIRWQRQHYRDDYEYTLGYRGEGGWELMRLRHAGQRAVWFARKLDRPGGEILVDLGLAYSVKEAKERAQFHEDYDA